MALGKGHLIGIGAMGTAAIEPISELLQYLTKGLGEYAMDPKVGAAVATIIVLSGMLGGVAAVPGDKDGDGIPDDQQQGEKK